MVTDLNRGRFERNPAVFLENVIKEFVADRSINYLQSFNGDRIFNEPLIGFADGDDTIFRDYKEIIGKFHLTPREALEKHLEAKVSEDELRPARVSVVSFVLPATYKTRLSERHETVVPSLRWNHTRHQGQDLINKLSLYLISLFEDLGYQAVAPELTDFYEMRLWFDNPGSNWSQRHIAYAAGLGTFSLNDGFITSKGIAHRCGSVVSNVALASTPRLHENYLANCLFYHDRSCQRCIQRCPVNAISEKGHDKKKCRDFMANDQRAILKELGLEGYYLGSSLVCGLCQARVPCEHRIPPDISGKN